MGALRGKAVVLMDKNTMMRKVIRGQLDKNPDLEKLLPHVKMNVGFVFTKMELTEIRDLLLANKKEAPAKAGAIAPIDVTIPAQNTGMGPRRLPSSRLSPSQPRLPRVQLKLSKMSPSSRLVTRSELPRPLSSTC